MYQVCDVTPQIRDIKVLKSQYLLYIPIGIYIWREKKNPRRNFKLPCVLVISVNNYIAILELLHIIILRES